MAIICFAPDYGHAQPLLKIADALAEAGFKVKCYLANECAPLVARFSFDVALFEDANLSEQKKILVKIFARSIFFNSVCAYAHRLFLWPNVMKVAAKAAANLRQDLGELRPDLIIADMHWFRDWSAQIATSIGVPLLVLNPDGSFAYNQTAFVRTYGITTTPEPLQRMVEIAMAVSKTCCAIYYRLRYFRTWLKVRAKKRSANIAFNTAFPVARTALRRIEWMVFGTAPIERDRLGTLVKKAGADIPEFPPIKFRSPLALSEELGEWIDRRGDEPIVYVSFGSAVEFDRAFACAVYEGLRNISARVLWSLTPSQKSLLSGLPTAQHIRLEFFVPQAEILNISSVRCFITQAGTSSVQEALLSGTPMLCIPFFVDQAYNSSVVQYLRAGVRMWRRQATSQNISAAVKDILKDETYTKVARNISDELARKDGGELVARHVAKLISHFRKQKSELLDVV